jgi:hypothetical protein
VHFAESCCVVAVGIGMKEHLPQRLRSTAGRRMTDAYHADSALETEAALLP